MVDKGVNVRYILAGSSRIIMQRQNAPGSPSYTTSYIHKDHLGSTSIITNDIDGGWEEKSTYQAYGLDRTRERQPTAPENDYRYTGQEQDPEAGLYNYNARLYDPAAGIFISADTIVPDYADPQSLNRYLYARGNPLLYVDPSGHVFLIDDILIGAAIGAAIGGATSAITGGDIGQGMLTGAISGAFFGGVGHFIHGAEAAGAAFQKSTQIAMHTGAGMAAGGINSAITGGNIGIGMVTGGISGGLGMAFGKQGALTWGDYPGEIAKRSLIGGFSGGVAAEMYGGRFGDGFVNGAKTAAIGASANCFAPLIVIGGVLAVKGLGYGIYKVGSFAAGLLAGGGDFDRTTRILDGVSSTDDMTASMVFGSGIAGLGAASAGTAFGYTSVAAGTGAYSAYVSLMVAAGSDSGQRMVSFGMDFIGGWVEGDPPPSTIGGLTGTVSRDIYDRYIAR